MSARKGEVRIGTRVGGKRGDLDPSRIGGKAVAFGGRAPTRPPPPPTGKSRKPARSRPPSKVDTTDLLPDRLNRDQATQYLSRLQGEVSRRQYEQEVQRVNREIRETGAFIPPSGTILSGLESSVRDREIERVNQLTGGRGLPKPEPEPEPEPEPLRDVPSGPREGGTFTTPSARFEVERIGAGSNVDEFEEPLQRRRQTARTPTAQPSSDPFASIGGVSQINERLRTGGASGGLPTQRSAPQPSLPTTQQLLEQRRANFIAGAGLQRGRSVDTAEASGELSAGAQFLLRQREEKLARQLSSEPLGREQVANPISGRQ